MPRQAIRWGPPILPVHNLAASGTNRNRFCPINSWLIGAPFSTSCPYSSWAVLKDTRWGASRTMPQARTMLRHSLPPSAHKGPLRSCQLLRSFLASDCWRDDDGMQPIVYARIDSSPTAGRVVTRAVICSRAVLACFATVFQPATWCRSHGESLCPLGSVSTRRCVPVEARPWRIERIRSRRVDD